MSMLLSQVIAPSSSPTVSTSLFCLHLYSCPVNRFICTIFLDSISQFGHSVVSNSLQPLAPQHARPPCP